MLVRARTVVPMVGEPIENGAVQIEGDRIVAVGKFNELKTHQSDIIDLGERILLPGLINAHCHLDYTSLRAKIPRQTSFTDWIRAINAAKAKISPPQYVDSINQGFAEAARFGTTTVANLTAFPELISQITAPIRTWWFAELIDIRQQPNDVTRIAENAVAQLKSAGHWGLAPHAPFTASPNLFRECAKIARRQNALLTTHLAESVEELEMSSEMRGPLRDFLGAINPNLLQSNGRTPVEELIRSVGSVDDRWLIVHLNSIRGSDAQLLADQSTKCHVIHCPQSHEYFGHERFQFEQLRVLGFNICLGTDSLASNEDLSLFAEMRRFKQTYSDISYREIIEMVTINAARALQQESMLGRIQPGAFADLIAIDHADANDVFEQVVNNTPPVAWSMVAGQQL